MNDPKVIHAHVFNPRTSLFKSHRNDRAELHTITCGMSDRCEVYARGQCIARMFLQTCRFGRAVTEQGPTPKAAKFNAWVGSAMARAKPIGTLDCATQKMARIGDHVWLPYAHIGLARSGNHAMFTIGETFVPVEEFTADLVVRLCEARPQAMFGGEIRAYQSESVPKFVAHLVEMWPDLLREAAERSPRIREVLAASTKVGQKAKLSTVTPNVGLFNAGLFNAGSTMSGWTWDGEFLTCATPRGFPPFTPFNAVEMRIRPGADATVVITDDAQVNANTVFED